MHIKSEQCVEIKTKTLLTTSYYCVDFGYLTTVYTKWNSTKIFGRSTKRRTLNTELLASCLIIWSVIHLDPLSVSAFTSHCSCLVACGPGWGWAMWDWMSSRVAVPHIHKSNVSRTERCFSQTTESILLLPLSLLSGLRPQQWNTQRQFLLLFQLVWKCTSGNLSPPPSLTNYLVSRLFSIIVFIKKHILFYYV